MRFLFSHNNYPAQFRRLIPALIDEGHEVAFLCQSKEWHAPDVEGVRLIKFEPHRAGGGAAIHPYLRRFEQAVLQGQAAYRALQPLVQRKIKSKRYANILTIVKLRSKKKKLYLQQKKIESESTLWELV